jgi:hypothetical protein
MNMEEDDDGEKLVPLTIERSKSQQVGLKQPFNIRSGISKMQKTQSKQEAAGLKKSITSINEH